MTVTHVTHVVVKDTPPPNHVMTVGRLYPIGTETVFRTQTPSPAPAFTADEDEDVELASVEDAETKVVRRGRRPKPAANEDVELKDVEAE